MALRIGKKKDQPSDDWSESTPQGDPATTGSPPPPTTTATEPADAFVTDNFAPATPPKKSLSPVLLAAGLVLLLTAAGVGAYFMFSGQSAETTDTTVAVAPTDPGAPGDPAAPVDPAAPTDPAAPAPNAPAPAPRVAKAPAKTAVTVKPKRGVPAKKVAPGRAGLVPPGTKAPSVRTGAGKPAMVPRPKQPTPVPIMPDGVAAQDGRGLPEGAAVPAVQPKSSIPPALFAQLKTLWQEGAAAKKRGDKAGARKAWNRILQLRPGHPGIQEAINKL